MHNDPKVMAKVRRELGQLAKAGPIDTSDAPVLPPPAWENPIRGMEAWLKTVRAGGMYKPVKQAVSMRLDADVVAWLRESGPGYQTRANRILREKMMKEMAG
ncbi:MAG TPA: BrnA antitoxin family protein [Terracidiphilus sp.]|nr:BrnA antitoxin family protein [Terracidiphilus sp.]